jgi:hypothetical protein
MTAIEILLALILIVLFFGLPRERRNALLKFLFWSAMIIVIAAIVAGEIVLFRREPADEAVNLNFVILLLVFIPAGLVVKVYGWWKSRKLKQILTEVRRCSALAGDHDALEEAIYEGDYGIVVEMARQGDLSGFKTAIRIARRFPKAAPLEFRIWLAWRHALRYVRRERRWLTGTNHNRSIFTSASTSRLKEGLGAINEAEERKK